MLAQAVLLAAFVCNAWGAPYVVTNPEDLHSTWYSHDYNATREVMPGDATRWEFTVKGRNGVPDPGFFAASCHGLQERSLRQKKLPAFVPCNDTLYEARQYFSEHGTTVEVRRTAFPDLGKKVQISATANYTTNDDITMGRLTFGDFHTTFISTLGEN
ncbi:hypothetical protein F53441_1940 [Fusarium austroafricanum]|uniref:Uncharacterized protein n=1 Tax=Fusarium austroafricanum TaxID=2364996 RepID=A0A8H4KTB8_9HYPO|nr:hypothetical protein F53441_1940 [Fusarium austroafricanum]